MQNIVSSSLNMSKGVLIVLLILLHISLYAKIIQVDTTVVVDNPLNAENIPPQPKKSDWKFIEEIKKPMWTRHDWGEARPRPDHVDLSSGVNFKIKVADPARRLETAYKDLHRFFAAGNVKSKGGRYTIDIAMIPGLKNEAFRIEVDAKSCRILATDIEGIRRGIFYIEDKMLQLEGPFLPLGTMERGPILQRRISRCFFSPIKRPGNHDGLGDELLDELDYYPDEYLNRLAHEGVNGLWVTVSSKDGKASSVGFGDLVSTSVTPNTGVNGEKRLAKLQRVVEQCLRYGIRIYIKTMEPYVRFNENDPILKRHPDILGNTRERNLCAGSEIGQQYLYEAVNKIFRVVPELGGMINISHGELYTTCLSALPATGGGHIDCPRCSKLEPWEILYASTSAMKRGMADASPNAELISWLYMPQPQSQSLTAQHNLADWVYTIPANTPEGVILQFNFESGVKKTVFGKELIGGDYWIATPGPSSRFERVAELAKEKSTMVSAKIQTGTSYSVATVPYVPVPSLLYQKFAAMRRLGVSHTMLNWIVGAAPGLMNKAAGELSFEPFPEDEDTFLHQLASIYWKKEDVPKVVQAWKCFSEGFQNYPLDNLFQYYGPMSDGPVWPLLLKPMDKPLSPTYQLGTRETSQIWPPSGDRIGESFPDNLTFEEMVKLCSEMSSNWDHGVEIMKELESKYENEPERILDIGVAKALGIHFRSGYNILHFYLLRDKMFSMTGTDRLAVLAELEEIINEEIAMNEQLIILCQRDSRLGFHADAEGYKYYPEKIQWRIEQLKGVLSNDMPELEAQIRKEEALFPEYTGEKPVGPIAYAMPSDLNMYGNSLPSNKDYEWQSLKNDTGLKISWTTSYDADALYIIVVDSTGTHPSNAVSSFSNLHVRIQPRRLWPSKQLNFNLGAINRSDEARVVEKYGTKERYAIARIPFEKIGLDAEELHSVRIDIRIQMKDGRTAAWMPRNPYLPRLILGTDDPSDLGWLQFN